MSWMGLAFTQSLATFDAGSLTTSGWTSEEARDCRVRRLRT
jgi:hypothetical protein